MRIWAITVIEEKESISLRVRGTWMELGEGGLGKTEGRKKGDNYKIIS